MSRFVPKNEMGDEDDDYNFDELEEEASESDFAIALKWMLKKENIELNPVYQRQVVWPALKQMQLIDSLLRNMPIPPLIFNETTKDDGEPCLVCMDGKQRITSIQNFMDGIIPYKHPTTRKNWWFTKNPDIKHRTKFLQLPTDIVNQFKKTIIGVTKYTNLSQELEREMFARVQLGMPLTTAGMINILLTVFEKLQAISSPWATWISDLTTKHVHYDDGLADRLMWETKRGRDFQCIAHFVYCVDGLLRQEERVPLNPKIQTWISRDDPPPSSFRTAVDGVLADFLKIASDEDLRQGLEIKARVAPVEFTFIAVMLFALRDQPINERAKQITKLRTKVREKFQNVNVNNRVVEVLWQFISDAMVKFKVRKRRIEDVQDDHYEEQLRVDPDGDYHPEGPAHLREARQTRSRKRARSE